jgi:hypothetical protein
MTSLIIILRIAIGYVAAVLVAVVVASFAMTAQGADGVTKLHEAIGVGLIVTFPCALPGFLVAILIAAQFRLRSWLFYAPAGALNAVPSLAIFAVYFGDKPSSLFDLLPFCLSGGLAGGFAYWVSAGRYLGGKSDANPASA